MSNDRSPAILSVLVAAACLALAFADGSAARATPAVRDVTRVYGDIAEAAYADALTTARTLQTAVTALVTTPSPTTLDGARAAWVAARVPYMQTEVFRFGNPIVDALEGRVNAWPLDEGLIDYVAPSYGTASDSNPLYTANVIATPKLTVGGRPVDATAITKSLLADTLHQADKVEANVAAGYHAIEFLLWGQDLNGTGPGAGNRPATDFDVVACTGGHCDRRRDYLTTAVELLIDHLAEMVEVWRPSGAARNALEGSDQVALIAIFTGIGSLSFGEMAGERMRLGLLLNDPEEEHDCFSDNTHNSHFYNVVGIENVYLGRYRRTDGTLVSGASVSDLVRARSPEADSRVRAALAASVLKFGELKRRAETIEAYDQMLGEGNAAGNAMVEGGIAALIAHTAEVERAIAVLELKPIAFQRSESLDAPDTARAAKK